MLARRSQSTSPCRPPTQRKCARTSKVLSCRDRSHGQRPCRRREGDMSPPAILVRFECLLFFTKAKKPSGFGAPKKGSLATERHAHTNITWKRECSSWCVLVSFLCPACEFGANIKSRLGLFFFFPLFLPGFVSRRRQRGERAPSTPVQSVGPVQFVQSRCSPRLVPRGLVVEWRHCCRPPPPGRGGAS